MRTVMVHPHLKVTGLGSIWETPLDVSSKAYLRREDPYREMESWNEEKER